MLKLKIFSCSQKTQLKWDPPVHEVVSFSSVLQILLQDLNHHNFVERCLRNHFIKFGGKLTPLKPSMAIFYTPQLSNW